MPLSEGRLPVEDRATQFSDAIYEVIAAYDGVPVLMEEHLDRWERSAAGLRIESPYSRETREHAIRELVRLCGAPRIMIYGQLTRGTAKRAHPFPKGTPANEFWYVRPLPPPNEQKYREGAGAVTHPDERWARCWIKTTSLLPNCLAKQYALDSGAFEAVLYTDDGTVTECTAANLYAVSEGTIHTHPATARILAGIKRELILRLAREEGFPVREEPFDLELLRKADEVFVSSTTLNALPITTLDGKPVGDGKVGPVSVRIGEKIAAFIADKVSRSGAAAPSGAG